MLINVRISELSIDSLNSIPLAILVGILFKLSIDNTDILTLINININKNKIDQF